jgi:hypothetical protein
MCIRDRIYTSTEECLRLHREKEGIAERLGVLYELWEGLA